MKDATDLARGWFAKAESDLIAVRLLLGAPGPYDTACFHTQQAAEKYLKGFLSYHNRAFPFTHDLQRLAKLCSAVNPALQLGTPDVLALTDYACGLRYARDFWPSKQDAVSALGVAERVRADILAALPPEVHPHPPETAD
jgi:HEPN domain-containing protein